MEDFRRMQKLCRVETGHEAQDASDPRLLAWKATKRPFTREELVGSYLLKLGELCGGYMVHLKADGSIEELNIFEPTKSWPCKWRILDDGALRIACGVPLEKGLLMCYLDALASREGTVHGACETNDEAGSEVVEHFKLIHLGPIVMLPGRESHIEVSSS